MEDLNPKEKLVLDSIINENYNPRMFFKFLSFKKPNGDDIDNWTIKELKKLINEYKGMVDGEEEGNENL